MDYYFFERLFMKSIALIIVLFFAISIRTEAQTTALPNIDCDLFPPNHIFNTRLDTLLASGHIQVDSRSNTWLNNMGRTRTLRPDFGEVVYPENTNFIVGIPYNVVDATQPDVAVNYYLYGNESDPGPMPIPPNALREGGPTATSGDRHVLVVDDTDCILYELWYAYKNANNSWEAGSGAIFDLMSHWLRPDGWTSSDAAGLPILPFLPRYEDILAGEMMHALRFTLPTTAQAYVWPARHAAGSDNISNYPPMGQIFLLNPNFDISGLSPEGQIIATAMKRYGIILADNGSAGFVSGTHDSRWNIGNLLDDFREITFNDFVAVDICKLRVHADSGEASINANPSGTGCTRNQGYGLAGGYARGRVSDPLGNPLAGITVSASGAGITTRTTTSDSLGTYIIYQIPRNQNFVLSANGVALGLNVQWWDNSETLGGATTIQLTNSVASAYHRNFLLGELDALTGTVYASNGTTPLPNVPIWVSGRTSVVCTDANGNFSVDLVVGLMYRIGAGGNHASCADNGQVLRWYVQSRTANFGQALTSPNAGINIILPDVTPIVMNEQQFLAELQAHALDTPLYPLVVDMVAGGAVITLSQGGAIGTAQVGFISENGLVQIRIIATTGTFPDTIYRDLPQMVMGAFDDVLARAGVTDIALEDILVSSATVTFRVLE
jgi:hypothetical protein